MCFLVTVAKERNFRHFSKLVQEKKRKRKVAPLLENVALLPVTRLNFACVGNLSEMSNFAV